MSDLLGSAFLLVFYDLKVRLSPKDRVSQELGLDLVFKATWVYLKGCIEKDLDMLISSILFKSSFMFG